MNSLRERIMKYLRSTGTWINGGEIERLALGAGYKASNASRRCRELCEEGLIERREDKKGFVEYSALKPKQIVEYRIEGREPIKTTLW